MTMMVDCFPVEGETVNGKNFQQLHGGKGSNQAIAAARLGGNVTYVGCVGNDDFGNNAFQLWDDEGINRKHVKHSEKCPTGVGFVTVDAKGENIISIDLSANFDLTGKDIEGMADLIKSSKVLLMQLEMSDDAVLSAARIAHENGVTVVLNPAPYRPMSQELLDCVDYLTPNETEAKRIVGLEPDAEISEQKLSEKLLAAGLKNVVITWGKRGAFISTEKEKKFLTVKSVPRVDSTGAGDTFSAALTVALSEGKSLDGAVTFANSAATLAVTKYGVIESMPHRNDVDQFMEDL